MNIDQRINSLINDLHGKSITHARLFERLKALFRWQAVEINKHIDSIEYEKGVIDGILKHKQAVRLKLNQSETLEYNREELIRELRKML